MSAAILVAACVSAPAASAQSRDIQSGDTAAAREASSKASDDLVAPRLVAPPMLPHAITSFGACRSGGWLYVYGGHTGRAHAHSRDNVVGSFFRLNLTDGQSWQALRGGPALQGTSLVSARDGRIYRVGGMTAHNAAGETSNMESTASVDRYDPKSNKWEAVTPLPEARSSHDAIVCGDHLYVIGGWKLQGSDGDWHDTSWRADLRKSPLVWEELPKLGHRRRACAVATFGGKIAVLGGIGGRKMINSVRVFDPAKSAWSDAPDLPASAFGTAALGVDGWLYATVMDGRLLRWKESELRWQRVAQFETPRFFHRMIPSLEEGRIVVMGGAGRGGHMRTIEHVAIDGKPRPEIREYVLPAPSRVAYRQALLMSENTIYAFGGNRGLKGDRFAPAQFSNDVWKISLTSMTAEMAGKLPMAVQSMAAVSWKKGRGTRNVMVGGIANMDGKVGSSKAGFRWSARGSKCETFDAALPDARTQHQVVRNGKKIYVIGGVDFTPNARGGSTKGDTLEILVADAGADEPRFEKSGIVLPRPRRSFGAAVMQGKLYLIGGLGKGFNHAGPCDVYDFVSKTWSELEAPANWVSPQVAKIGRRLYVACGGTMKGMRFRQDASLKVFEPGKGWSTVVEQLPFPVRHVQMLAMRNRLLFYAANDKRGGRIVLRVLEPDADVQVLEKSFH